LWSGSHHDLAMQSADAASVLGAFDGRRMEHADVTSTFTQDAEGFHVRTDGPDGSLQDYKVSYAFGVDPLQQYLIETSPGRLQALSLFWDARPAAAGGQTWRHLHPDETIDHRDPLHWTGPAQNWNYMCAECHSTGVRKSYSAEENRFRTTSAEMNVSCEACHGPGSRHVAWALEARADVPDRGLEVRLSDSARGTWVFKDNTGIARRSRPRASDAVVETCGLCHARRVPLVDGYHHGRPLADSHRVVLLEEGLYYADGQIHDEDYEYGSFLQSAMHAAGVTCTDCHDPHAAGKHAVDDGVCSRCHRPARFSAASHHHHRRGSAGASCIACHMPVRTYMVVDARHDHSFRVPRPDLSLKIGVPDSCTACHQDRTPAWAAEAAARWYPNGRTRVFQYGEALQAGRTWSADRAPLLRRVISDPNMPAIVRATAMSLLGRQVVPEDLPQIDRGLADADPLVRRSALEALESLPDSERWRRARALLSDPIRSVRLQAADLLADMPRKTGEPPGPQLQAAFDEYLASQQCNADRAEAWLNMGSFHLRGGDLQQAESDYRRATALVPSFIPAYVNLADLYRIQSRDPEGEEILRRALRLDPSDEARYALGLLLVRRKRLQEGIEEIRRASQRPGGDPRFLYALGIALRSAGRDTEALRTLEDAYRRFPGNREIVLALATLERDRGSRTEAMDYARKAVALAPSEPGARRLLEDLTRTP
jgi:tetratricopeptide (TPR) repeat protein